VCQSCAVECRIEGSNETAYKMCCEDGPVFDAKEVVFQTQINLARPVAATKSESPKLKIQNEP